MPCGKAKRLCGDRQHLCLMASGVLYVFRLQLSLAGSRIQHAHYGLKGTDLPYLHNCTAACARVQAGL